MKKTKEKIKAYEHLFRIAPSKMPLMAKQALSANELSELKTIMSYIKSEAPLPKSLVEWLAQLGLLYGVPFNHLVVDEKLLSTTPSEKHPNAANVLRFFYIDMNWIDSMMDGALSIGTHNSKDFRLQQAVHKAFRPDIENAMLEHRQKIKGKPIVERYFPEKMGTLGGFIMRSPIIAQWPGIEIKGYSSTIETADFNETTQDFEDPEKIMEVLRMERLAADTLLMIFKGVPKCILIKEPSEGVYSGFNDVDNQEYRLALRHLTGENRIGQPITNSTPYLLEGNFRSKEKRVINIAKLGRDLKKEFNKKDKKIKTLRSKDMAVQLINSPRFHFFQNK